MTLPSRLPCIRRDAKCPISIRPPHQSAEIYALSSGVFHFNESGTLGVWRAVEDNIDVIHWGTPRYYCPARPYCESAWAVADFVPWRRPVSVWPTSMIGLCQEKTRFSRRALRRSAQILSLQNSQPRSVPSRRGLLPFAEPDIHLLSPATCGDLHRRLSLCSLPVSKQSGGSLGSLRSVAQSATCKTWQAAY